MAGTERKEEETRTLTEADASVWEWVVAAASALLVVAAVGYVLYKAVAETATPPQIVIEVEEIQPGAGNYLVVFWAHNRGAATAKGLTVEGELVADTGVVATRSAAITFVPGESKRKAGMFFPVDPRQYRLRLYATGWEYP